MQNIIIESNGIITYTNSENQIHRKDGPAVLYPNGYEMWFKNGLLHREDGPAIFNHEEKEYYIEGYRHREDGPSFERKDGYKMWYFWNKLHRINGPAIEYPEEENEYYIDNTKISKDSLSSYINCIPIKSNNIYPEHVKIIKNENEIRLIEHWNKKHKTKIRDDDINIKIYHNTLGQLHREDGPAIETLKFYPLTGYQTKFSLWFKNGKRHRENGPAVETSNNYCQLYYLNGALHREDGPAAIFTNQVNYYYNDGKLYRKNGPAIERFP